MQTYCAIYPNTHYYYLQNYNTYYQQPYCSQPTKIQNDFHVHPNDSLYIYDSAQDMHTESFAISSPEAELSSDQELGFYQWEPRDWECFGYEQRDERETCGGGIEENGEILSEAYFQSFLELLEEKSNRKRAKKRKEKKNDKL